MPRPISARRGELLRGAVHPPARTVLEAVCACATCSRAARETSPRAWWSTRPAPGGTGRRSADRAAAWAGPDDQGRPPGVPAAHRARAGPVLASRSPADVRHPARRAHLDRHDRYRLRRRSRPRRGRTAQDVELSARVGATLFPSLTMDDSALHDRRRARACHERRQRLLSFAHAQSRER